MAHGCQVPVGSDVVALDSLSALRVLSNVSKAGSLDSLPRRAHLVVTGPHQGIVAQVAANVGGDDFAIDAVSGDKVFVHAGA